jgi:hypothetical protein
VACRGNHLADQHYQFRLAWDRHGLVQRMQMLRGAKFGPLGGVAPY